MPDILEEKERAHLPRRVKDRRRTLFHGSGVFSKKTPVSFQIAKELVKKYDFPVEDHFCRPYIQVYCLYCLEYDIELKTRREAFTREN